MPASTAHHSSQDSPLFRYFSEDFDNYPGPSPEEEYQRDVKIDEAKDEIMKEVFGKDPRTVMYERQLLVRFEDQFFHWITAKALTELRKELEIDSQKLVLAKNTEIRFYISRGHRGWKLQARAIRDLVLRFAAPEFGHALGHQGEMLFDAALPRFGFMPADRNVKTWAASTGNKPTMTWTECLSVTA